MTIHSKPGPTLSKAFMPLFRSAINMLPTGDNKASPGHEVPTGDTRIPNSGVGHLTTTALTLGSLALPGPKGTSTVVDMTAAVKAPSILTAVTEGETIYRVWGGESGAFGHSWTPVDPGTVSDFRNAAGLPNRNNGTWTSVGTLTDTAGVSSRSALPLDGNQGGLPEYLIPNPQTQIEPKYSINNEPPK